MQLRELDETTVKYFIGNEFVFDVVENLNMMKEGRKQM